MHSKSYQNMPEKLNFFQRRMSKKFLVKIEFYDVQYLQMRPIITTNCSNC